MDVQLLLVPYDCGRLRWRCGAGPEHLLRAGLEERLQAQGHVIKSIRIVEDDPTHEPAEIQSTFELARRLAVQVREARAAGHFALVLSGNCFAALGTLNGLTPARRAAFWFDAHGDYNTPETTTSGFMDGMGLAAATGLGWQRLAATVPGFQPMEGRNTFFLGVRDLDPPEASLVRETGATLVAVEELPAGLPRILARAMLADTVGYIHLDPDVLDPSVGRANYLPVPDGLSVSQLTGTIAAIRARVPIHAAGIASYSPEDDHDQGIARAVFTAIDAILASGDAAPRL